MKNLVFISLFLATFFLSAQMVVESPETDALLATQMLLINELAIDSRTAETERFLEYLTQFADVISTIKKGQEAASKVLQIGRELKNKSREEWLHEVEKGLSGVFPDVGEILELKGKAGEGADSARAGKYAAYVAGWGRKLGEYHDRLLENYGGHLVFPELFPAAAQSGKDFIHAESAQKIVHKAWLESGMEYEMKNDAVRGEMFRRYYEEYLRDVRENDDDASRRLAEAAAAAKILKNTLKKYPDALIVMGGDLNDEPGSDTLQSFESETSFLRVANELSSRDQATYSYRGDAIAIDHIFWVKSGLGSYKQGSAEVVKDAPSWYSLGSSDHAALRATFEF